MSFIGKTIGKLTGAADQAKAATTAAEEQNRAANAGITEQRRQFEAFQQALKPYMEAGGQALPGMLDIAGVNGPQAQSAVIQALQGSPQFSALAQQGENAILQNASATGGLRGGNTQAALAQFRPQLLNQLIEQQYGRLGGLVGMGQSSAAGVGNAGMMLGQNVSNLMQQGGAASAGAQLAQGSVASKGFGNLMSLGGAFIAAGGVPGIKKLF